MPFTAVMKSYFFAFAQGQDNDNGSGKEALGKLNDMRYLN